METTDALHFSMTSSKPGKLIIDSFEDMITVAHIDSSHAIRQIEESMWSEITNTNKFGMILVLSGNAKISLDYKTYQINSDKLAFIIPTHVFRISEMSSDFNARFLVMDKSLIEEITREKKGSYNYISFKKNPIISLTSNEKANIEEALIVLRVKIRLDSHLYHREVVHNAISGLLLELLNILVPKNKGQVHVTHTRQEDIVDRFLKLLSEHAREQHQLSFYADKLFITAQYLSLVLKIHTGKSGSKWINEALMLEAKKLIKTPQATIQEVAYALNFSDQSTFGKFFKKSMGISPLLYRRTS